MVSDWREQWDADKAEIKRLNNENEILVSGMTQLAERASESASLGLREIEKRDGEIAERDTKIGRLNRLLATAREAFLDARRNHPNDTLIEIAIDAIAKPKET